MALLSNLAGNLFLTGSLANIIAVEHARIGVPITVLSLGLALLWLKHLSG